MEQDRRGLDTQDQATRRYSTVRTAVCYAHKVLIALSALNLPEAIALDYKAHDQSIKDTFSFRQLDKELAAAHPDLVADDQEQHE